MQRYNIFCKLFIFAICLYYGWRVGKANNGVTIFCVGFVLWSEHHKTNFYLFVKF